MISVYRKNIITPKILTTSIALLFFINLAAIGSCAPTWQNQGTNDTDNKISQGAVINLTAQGRDDVGLDWAWLSTNESSIWENKTAYNSPMDMNDAASTWVWSNFTWSNLLVAQGSIVGWRIYYNDTSDNQIGTDIMTFEIDRSVLEVNLSEPSTEMASNIIQNQTFTVNATVVCRGGPCGYVNGTVFYNLTSPYPDTTINTSYGDKPFFINESEALPMKSCPTNPLDENEFCNITWTINASGDADTDWKIGTFFNSSILEIQTNSTENATISIVPCTADFDLSWSYIQFGNTQLDPDTYNNSAIGNANNEYNITVNLGSCNMDFYIRGDDLENTTYNSVIKVGNISWSNISSDIDDGFFQLSSLNSPLKLNVPQDTNVTTWYWLNIPPTYSGYYNGTIYLTGVRNGKNP